MKYKIRENFRWMAAPEFSIVDTGKNTVTIKGVAVKKNQVSRNKRRYVGEELHAGARTFIGAPVTINHSPYDKTHPMYDGRKVAGHVDWMEYEDGQMEYRAKINKQPYVDLIRNNSVEVRGVSIEAEYLFNRCSHCGEDFFTAEEFDKHMHDEHFIKNYNYEPRGIVGKALSLVLSPEEPGVPDTTLELVESTRREGKFSQLLETIVSVHKKQEKHSMKQNKKVKPKIPYKTRTIMEQDEHGCAEDEHWDAEQEKCVKNESASEQEEMTPPCADGYHEVDGKCVKDEEPTASAEEIAEPDLALQSLEAPIAADVSTETPEVVPPDELKDEPEPLPPPPLDCGDGFHEENGACVPDETVPTVEPEANEPPAGVTEQAPRITLPRLMRLGEPFASYTSFDDCVSKNPDKEDPEAYCASVKQKTEGETFKETKAKQSRDVYEHIDLLYNVLRHNATKSMKRDSQIAESVNALNRAVAKLATVMPQAPAKLARELATLNKHNLALKKHMDNKLGQVATTDAKHHKQSVTEMRKLAARDNTVYKQLATEIRKLAAIDKQLRETIHAKTKDFESILAYADKNMGELKEHNKALETRVKEMEQEKADSEKKVKETSTLMTRIENLEDKLKKGRFQGKQLDSKTGESGEQPLGEESPYK